jgi:hypothetical protein
MNSKSRLLGLAALPLAALLLLGPPAAPPASAAGSIGPLTFSTDATDKWQPSGRVAINFSDDNNGVFVTFDFFNMTPGSRLSRIVRLNGEDFNWDGTEFGSLNCCRDGGSGRYGFRILKTNARRGELPGGAYEVRLYLDGADVGGGGFGIRGTSGGD